ncbi:DUF2061 domain-containing protein [Algiphilus sp.]|uniref:DUF2061 domain-containing protein n=1 Tax=Algiphilus sp. TaxID=1872431 RepID=UPI003BABF492
MIKTFTFALVHMSVAFTVVYLMTGNWVAGGAVALVEPACNTVAYAMHEKAWARWGRGLIGQAQAQSDCATDAGLTAH